MVLVGVAYYVTARLGLQLALVGKSVTPLWPPTGLAVVTLLGGGYRLWPAISVAALAVNLPISPTPAAAAVIAVGNTLAPLAATWSLRRVDFRPDLARVRDALALVVVALASMTISASFGTFALVASGAESTARIPSTWWVWWAGDAMGVLLVAPFLWCLRPLRTLRLKSVDRRRVAEGAALYAVLAVTVLLASRTREPILVLVVPLLVWAAWRYQHRGAAPAGLMASIIVIIAAVHDNGVFAGETLMQKMVVLQSFNVVVSFTAFFFAAAVVERRRASELVYEREHRVAETLQRSLLPEALPEIPGIAMCGRYIAASRDADIGGDWYDIFPLPNGRLGLVVGDVAGHGITAAAAMAQLRMALRGDATTSGGPAHALVRLNWLMGELHPDLMATLLYAEFDPASGAVRFARAGHPPPLRIDGSGAAAYVEGGVGPPIGVVPNAEYTESTCRVETGGVLVLFTDGLVERRDQSLGERLELLRQVASQAEGSLDASVDHIVIRMLDQGVVDDVALLAVRPVSLTGEVLHLERPARPSFVPGVRHLLGRWLVENGASGDEAYDVLVASTEAHTNAVRHAYRDGYGVVEIEATVERADVLITVRDHGTWREPLSEVAATGGRGLRLMEALMDATEINLVNGGTEIRMRRRLHG
jgi:integral membrane sensor domain MASE1/anti-sigma regulatory factor (Ser/Thr protein kinase)